MHPALSDAFGSRICYRSGLRALACLLALSSMAAAAGEARWAGFLSVEPRIFPEAPVSGARTERGISPSAVAAPELRYEWNDGKDRLTFAPYLRYDADDAARDHFDVREANWLRIAGPWTLRAGLGRVFWGVTEARHLVDIVNQDDRVEDIDEEDKLGQPMINVERYTSHGSFSLFLLPGFRERTFPADDARLSGPLPVADDRPVYESSAEEDHTDLALRWTHIVGPWDIGLSGFYGTGREPRLVPALLAPERRVLVPYYDLIAQFGLELQFTREAWLWKLESIRRTGQGDAFYAFVGGFEYTLFGIRGSGADLGLLAEYLYDGRSGEAPAVALEDDVFLGVRFALNDVDGTSLLAGLIVDRDTRGTVGFLEGERRFGPRWKLEMELRWLGDAEESVLAGVRRDSFLTIRVARFF